MEIGLTHLNVDTSKNQVDMKGISFKIKQTGLKWQEKNILILIYFLLIYYTSNIILPLTCKNLNILYMSDFQG